MPEPPLRICDLLAYFHPYASGAERQALAQGAELARRGHAVRVVTQAVRGSGLPKDEVIRGVLVHRWIEPVRVGPLFGLSFVAGAVRALRRLRAEYDLIHTHQGLWESISTGVARSVIDAPTLVQPASSGYFGEAEEMARTRGFPALRRLALRNTAFAAISEDIERQWLALGVPPSRMHRMASGVETDRFHPGPSAVESRFPPRPRVLFTGRLHPQKNLDVLLDAWAEVARRSTAHLILLGDGPDRGRLVAKAKDMGLADRVHFPGPVDDPADSLRAADVFVLPSVAEGMSNSLLEAMATGLPCIASEIGGNTDLLAEGPRGLLVPPGDRDGWADAILRVLGDEGLARSLGEAALGLIGERFAMPVVVDRYVDLYRSLLAGSG
ncbi:glycosyltransferase family 4 protein [Tautonia plasticadhaerens]|uniref:D-inositol 3-phosphate glycosyltransferase n=1 Tax=Tautonia plasticadhaerens TaxID=2527974 RepID=A0A518GYR2_9BACT|nr:glycosyltransferase family 4 protein [Tautonia plasticadhaerens]QDV33744.1 D-inositol 3-phosphate glycosyltransferase [Tautonia plasticadhaerens]